MLRSISWKPKQSGFNQCVKYQQPLRWSTRTTLSSRFLVRVPRTSGYNWLALYKCYYVEGSMTLLVWWYAYFPLFKRFLHFVIFYCVLLACTVWPSVWSHLSLPWLLSDMHQLSVEQQKCSYSTFIKEFLKMKRLLSDEL